MIKKLREAMSFHIVNFPEVLVIGKELRTTWMDNKCYSDIPAFWQKQRSENLIQKIPNKVYPDVILGLYTNYTSDFSLSSGYYSLIICSPVINVNDIPPGMVAKKIPATKYAVFTAKAHFIQLLQKHG